MARIDEQGYVHPTDDDVDPAADLSAQLARAWAEGFDAGYEHGNASAKWFAPEEPSNPYLPDAT